MYDDWLLSVDNPLVDDPWTLSDISPSDIATPYPNRSKKLKRQHVDSESEIEQFPPSNFSVL